MVPLIGIDLIKKNPNIQKKLKEFQTAGGIQNKDINELKDTGSFSTGTNKAFIDFAKQTKKPKAPTTNLSAGDYNTQARDQGREDWRTAYRGDILQLGDNTGLKPKDTIAPVKPTMETEQITPTPETQQITKVDGKDWELGQEELNIYNTLTPEQQSSFWLRRDQLAQNQTDYTKDLANYLQEANKTKDYLTGQQEKKTEINELTGEIQDIQSSQRIQNAQQQVENLKQNIGYLGTGGQPGVSSVKLDAVSRQVSNAEQTFSQLKSVENKIKQIRELGLDIDTAAYERQMEDLQTSLDNQVNTSIQSAYNDLIQADINGELDTIEEIEAFKNQVLAKMDTEIAGVTDKNFQERQFLIEQANLNVENANKKIVEYQKKQEEYQTNANTVNTQMSAVQGFYVDGNGNPIISATTGTTISLPQEAPMDPIFDKNTGQLVQFTTDENGNIVANVDQVIDQPTFEQGAITSFAKLVAEGRIDYNDVPEQVRNTETFLNTLSQIQPEAPTTQDWSKLDDNTLYNERTGETKTVSELTKGADPVDLINVPDGTIIPSRLSETTNSNNGKECAEYVNDMTGMGLGDSLQSKLNKMDNIATNSYEAIEGNIGDVAVWTPDPNNPLFSKYGHAGIIVGEQGDNWVIKSSNIKGDGAISTDVVPKQMIMGTSGNYDTTKLQPQETTQDDINKFKYSESLTANEQRDYLEEEGILDKYIKYQGEQPEPEIKPLTDKQFTQSNQIITGFKGDPQVKAFEEAYSQSLNLISSLQTKTGPGDVAAIFQFMKTLDPGSVVREGEFAVAAKSAGVTQYLGNTWDRITKGKKLTDKQSEAFGELAKQFIKNKATLYETKYNDGLKRLEKQGIDTSVFPQNIAEEMRNQLNTGTTEQKEYTNTKDIKQDFLNY